MADRPSGHHYARIDAGDRTAIHAGDYHNTRQIFMLDNQAVNLRSLKQQLATSKQRMLELQEQISTLEIIIAALENRADTKETRPHHHENFTVNASKSTAVPEVQRHTEQVQPVVDASEVDAPPRKTTTLQRGPHARLPPLESSGGPPYSTSFWDNRPSLNRSIDLLDRSITTSLRKMSMTIRQIQEKSSSGHLKNYQLEINYPEDVDRLSLFGNNFHGVIWDQTNTNQAFEHKANIQLSIYPCRLVIFLAPGFQWVSTSSELFVVDFPHLDTEIYRGTYDKPFPLIISEPYHRTPLLD